MITVKIRPQQEFELLKDEWKSLENGSDMTAFQSYSWYSMINEQYKKKAYIIPGKVFYAAAYDDEKIKMIAPLFIVNLPRFFSKFNIDSGAYILGKWGYTDYLNFIYDDFSAECFEQLIICIKERLSVSAFNLHQILPETSMCRYLDEKYSSSFLFEGDCVKIPVKENFETYNKELSKHSRQNLRTAQNRAAKDGVDIHYELYKSISEDDAKEFYSIYSERQKNKRKAEENCLMFFANELVSKAENKKKKRYNILTDAMTSLDNAFILGCYSGEEKIGLCFGLEDSNAIRIPVVCFKESYAKYSPCMVCIYQFIKDSYEKDMIKSFDLLKGTEQYKYRLGGETVSIKYYKITP